MSNHHTAFLDCKSLFVILRAPEAVLTKPNQIQTYGSNPQMMSEHLHEVDAFIRDKSHSRDGWQIFACFVSVKTVSLQKVQSNLLLFEIILYQHVVGCF